MTGPSRNPSVAWLAFAFVALANFGNFYVYDSIGPVAALLEEQRGFSDSQIGWLNAIYNLPNIVLLLVGGWLVDRQGAARMLVATGAICLAGALLTALGSGFNAMAAGRFLFGVGAETFNIATLTAIAKHFSGRHLAFAIGASIALGRAGAYAVDLSPTWAAASYAGGWQPPLLIAAAFAALSLVAVVGYAWIDRGEDPVRAEARLVAPRELFRFGPAYWYLLGLCVLWYAVIFAFRSTFAIKYFQHAHGLDLAAAGEINGNVYLAAIFAMPAFGWLCDRVGRYAPFLAFGTLLLPASFAAMAGSGLPLWVGTVLIGVSFSLVPAVMWPLAARLMPASKLGTALGLMWVVQNAGIAGANIAAGRLNDAFGAGAANPAGYGPMMLFFFAAGAVATLLAFTLWRIAGRRKHEQASGGR